MKNLSIKKKLYFMVLIILIPMLIYQTVKIYSKVHSNLELELKSNEDFAEAVGVSFINYLDKLWDTEFAIGLAIINAPTASMNEIGEYMKNVIADHPTIREYIWIDPNTLKIVASSNPHALDVSLAGREYLEKILNGEDKVVSDMMISRVYSDPTLLVARGIRKDNELKGIVIASINVEELDSIMPSKRATGYSFFGLIDKQGLLVYRSGIPNVASKMINVNDVPNVAPALKGEVIKVNKYTAKVDGKTMTGVFLPVKQTGWVSYANTSYDEVLSRTFIDIKNDLIILISISLICLLLSFRMGRQIIQHITILEQSALQMSGGNLNVRTNIKGTDEIAAAAQAFDKMADSLEQYDKQKTQFFSNLSHELKTPLNIILASIQMVQNRHLTYNASDDSDFLAKYISLMRQNCYRLLRLINNLIDITRIDSGFYKVNFGNYNIVSVVEDITLSVAHYSDTKGISIIFDTNTEEKVMAFDPDKIERIILNLLSNSIKFTPAGGNIFVDIVDKEDKLLISVRDTGVGIPPDKLSVIFDRFKQANSSLHREYEGSGIGLSLVKALVEAHNGQIHVESELEQGTKFTIDLPCSLLSEETLTPSKNLDSHNIGKVQRINIEFSDIYS